MILWIVDGEIPYFLENHFSLFIFKIKTTQLISNSLFYQNTMRQPIIHITKK